MAGKINIALIGTGFMGKAHSYGYSVLPIFFWPLSGAVYKKIIVDVTEQSAKDARDRYGFEKYTTNWEDAVSEKDIDLVDICVPNNLHREIAVAAAAQGKNILCEKPLSTSSEEAQKMVDAVNKNKVKNAVGFNYRCTPAVALAKKYIDEGLLGDIYTFRGTYLCDWTVNKNVPLSWRFQKKMAGTGSLGDIGSHIIDMARFLIGEIKSVSAITDRWIEDRPLPASPFQALGKEDDSISSLGKVDVDDSVSSLLKFENDVTGMIHAMWSSSGRKNYLTFEIAGSKGSIYFNYEKRDELQFYSEEDAPDRRGYRTIATGPAHPYGEFLWPAPSLGIGYGETMAIQMYKLVNMLMGDSQSGLPTFYDGLRACKVVDAVLESQKSHCWVNVLK